MASTKLMEKLCSFYLEAIVTGPHHLRSALALHCMQKSLAATFAYITVELQTAYVCRHYFGYCGSSRQVLLISISGDVTLSA